MRRFVLMGIVATSLAACAKPLEVGTISEIRSDHGAPGIDVYAARRRAGEKVPDLAGDQLLDVRSYVAEPGPLGGDMRGDEFPGARCVIRGRDFSAEAVTPARVRVPIYRLESSSLSVSCQHPDFGAKSVALDIYNKTKADRYAASSQGGLAGLVVMTAINEMSDETKHEFAYPLARVLMTPLRPKAAGR